MKRTVKLLCIFAVMLMLVSYSSAAMGIPSRDERTADLFASGEQETENGGNGESAASGGNSGGGGASSGRYRISSLEQATDFFNVQDYTIEESEKHNMHDFDTAMRRNNAIGEAWAVFEIPYVSGFDATSLHLPEDVAPMKFEFSKDGENWTEADVTVTEEPTDGRWTEVTYSASQISGVRYVKLVWGEEENLQNWWNPYFIALTARKANPYDAEIVIDTDENICIPRYDSREYCLSGRVLDQIGLERENEIIWFNVSQNPDEISVSRDGKFTVSSDMTVGTEFTVQAQCGMLTAEKTFTLCATLPGDSDGDNIITQTDIDFILENYGKTANIENRLCDVDKNGIIDIIDLCYAARYMNIDFNKQSDKSEKGTESETEKETTEITDKKDGESDKISTEKDKDGETQNDGVGDTGGH